MPFAELAASLPRVLAQATGRRVVCCSDDPDGIETLGAYLAERGYLVRTVLSIPEAVAAVMLGGADLLLCEDSETAELGMQRLLARHAALEPEAVAGAVALPALIAVALATVALIAVALAVEAALATFTPALAAHSPARRPVRWTPVKRSSRPSM